MHIVVKEHLFDDFLSTIKTLTQKSHHLQHIGIDFSCHTSKVSTKDEHILCLFQ